MVERKLEELRVSGSNPFFATFCTHSSVGLERYIDVVEVVDSSSTGYTNIAL